MSVECGICMMDLLSKEGVPTALLCGHCFHSDCLQAWWKNRLNVGPFASCPSCRRQFPKSQCIRLYLEACPEDEPRKQTTVHQLRAQVRDSKATAQRALASVQEKVNRINDLNRMTNELLQQLIRERENRLRIEMDRDRATAKSLMLQASIKVLREEKNRIHGQNLQLQLEQTRLNSKVYSLEEQLRKKNLSKIEDCQPTENVKTLKKSTSSCGSNAPSVKRLTGNPTRSSPIFLRSVAHRRVVKDLTVSLQRRVAKREPLMPAALASKSASSAAGPSSRPDLKVQTTKTQTTRPVPAPVAKRSAP